MFLSAGLTNLTIAEATGFGEMDVKNARRRTYTPLPDYPSTRRVMTGTLLEFDAESLELPGDLFVRDVDPTVE